MLSKWELPSWYEKIHVKCQGVARCSGSAQTEGLSVSDGFGDWRLQNDSCTEDQEPQKTQVSS